MNDEPELVQAIENIRTGKLALDQPLLRSALKKYPADVSAICLQADFEIKEKRYGAAKKLLRRCLELEPGYTLARNNYTVVLLRRLEYEEALSQAEILLTEEPENPKHLFLKGSILVRIGDHSTAMAIFESVVDRYPDRAKLQLSYGHALKAVGRAEEAIVAYRHAIDYSSGMGEAYWSLANLKTFRFTDDDLATMRTKFSSDTHTGDKGGRSHLAFALAKTLEDRKSYDESFSYYQRGNAIRRPNHRYDPKKNRHNAARQIHSCNTEFFAQRQDWGCPAIDPIFIVGLPRAGSTLLEQILASHSAVEGTAELPDIISISRKLEERKNDNPATQYPQVLAELSREKCVELGEGYLASTQIQRSHLPLFIDKMPNNFLHIGLIHLILPNAKVIDVRRHPMAGCFACYKQLFAQGQNFTYDLRDVAHYYHNYINVMDHWDEVLPGKVLRVQYENMVSHPERQIRRLLKHCDLPFEQQCLRFYDTERTVRTPSSEQVRQPIFTQGLEQWRHYEKHLVPLKKALGPLLQRDPTCLQTTD